MSAELLNWNADAQRDAEMPAATEGTVPQQNAEAGPNTAAGSGDHQSQPSKHDGSVTEAAV